MQSEEEFGSGKEWITDIMGDLQKCYAEWKKKVKNRIHTQWFSLYKIQINLWHKADEWLPGAKVGRAEHEGTSGSSGDVVKWWWFHRCT